MKVVDRKNLMAQVLGIVQKAQVQNKQELVEFVETLIADIDKRIETTAKDKKKRNEFSAQLNALVASTINSADYLSGEEIAEVVSEQMDKPITKDMVSAHVSKLIKAGRKIDKKVMRRSGVRKTYYKYVV